MSPDTIHVKVPRSFAQDECFEHARCRKDGCIAEVRLNIALKKGLNNNELDEVITECCEGCSAFALAWQKSHGGIPQKNETLKSLKSDLANLKNKRKDTVWGKKGQVQGQIDLVGAKIKNREKKK